MIESLLVANRGEIACRIFRTARDLNIRTIAVYSEADVNALHVGMADQAICIGPPPATESYLDIHRILEAARESGAEAIHPGYGFLSENAEFAEACNAAGVIFVGPPAEAIRVMGSKTESKRLMEEAGVPVLPGYHGSEQNLQFLKAQGEEIGYPLLIKASAGGGGKGMRIVENAGQFDERLASAQREARGAFGDDQVLLERYLTAPKHIEVQLMADTHGSVVHLFERDCSVQRRHQKVIEEAPGPTVTAELREQLGETAIMAARQVGYVGAGTVEFIAEGDDFYFMEMNTRLQVEHPVTEAITGLDLVDLQLRVASGEALPIEQDDVQLRGHAIEVRLYAENPRKKFLPSTGTIERFEIPGSVRVDSGVAAGSVVSMHYDPMLAKIIAYADDRQGAIDTLGKALGASAVAGVEHNLGYLRGLLEHDNFAAGDYTTSIADDVHEEVLPRGAEAFAARAAKVLLQDQGEDPWLRGSGFRLNQAPRRSLELRQGKTEYAVTLEGESAQVNGELTPVPEGEVLERREVIYAILEGHTERFLNTTDDLSRYGGQQFSAGGIRAPMPGQVIAVHVSSGDKVKAGDVVAVVEAMKMEHSVTAGKSGEVKAVLCAVGDRVEEGVELVELE